MGKFLVILAACVVPLIVAAHIPTGDLFSYWKAVTVISIGGVAMIMLNSIVGLVLAVLFIFSLLLDNHMRPSLFENTATYVAYVSIFLLSVRYARASLLPWLTVSSCIIAAVGIAQFAGYHPITWFIEATCGGVVKYTSITSTLHNENYIGHYVALVLPVMVVVAAEKNPWYWIPTAALVALLTMSLSWLGVLGVVASFALYLCLPGRGLLPKFYVSAALIVAMLSFTAWKTPTGAARILTKVAQKASLNVDNNDKLYGSRGYIWQGSVAATKLWPQGPGRLAETFEHDPLREFKIKMKPYSIIDRPHSVYLQIAHAFGWWGLSFFLALTGTLAWRCAGGPFPPSERAFMVGCWLGVVGFHFAGILNDGGPAIWPVYAVLFGAGVSGGFDRSHLV